MNDDGDGLPDMPCGLVTVSPIPPMCSRCVKPICASTFRIALESEKIEAALDKAMEGIDVVLPDLSWICSACAVLAFPCPDCGGIRGGMPLPWFIDDDGLVTCNPFARAPFPPPARPGSCVNSACPNYSVKDSDWFRKARRHAIGYQGFPDPYADVLGDPGVQRGASGEMA